MLNGSVKVIKDLVKEEKFHCEMRTEYFCPSGDMSSLPSASACQTMYPKGNKQAGSKVRFTMPVSNR